MMTAYSIVRFRTKSGLEGDFLKQYRELPRSFDGLRKIALIKTGPGSFCGVGEWESMEHVIAARPAMIGNLDTFRHTLEELGADLGVTDAVSGDAVYEVNPGISSKA